MESISIRGTSKTPRIDFSPDAGLLKIKGRSSPENSKIFYNPLIAWCEEYVAAAPDKTTVTIQLEHFNTVSSKSLLDFFKTLKLIKEQNKELMVTWYYEFDDEEILEAGQNYEEITGLPFIMIPY